MARIGGILICIIIVIMDAIAGILGIEAEINQNKGREMRVFIFECKEPVYAAYKLGISAAALLAVSHALANLLGGCVCICSQVEFVRSSTNRQLASITLILSWVALVVGFSLLLSGALANANNRTSCGFARHHFLSFGGILCFVHGLLAVAYYVTATAAAWDERLPMVHREVKGSIEGTTQVVRE